MAAAPSCATTGDLRSCTHSFHDKVHKPMLVILIIGRKAVNFPTMLKLRVKMKERVLNRLVAALQGPPQLPALAGARRPSKPPQLLTGAGTCSGETCCQLKAQALLDSAAHLRRIEDPLLGLRSRAGAMPRQRCSALCCAAEAHPSLTLWTAMAPQLLSSRFRNTCNVPWTAQVLGRACASGFAPEAVPWQGRLPRQGLESTPLSGHCSQCLGPATARKLSSMPHCAAVDAE